jgi:hypothetical protein
MNDDRMIDDWTNDDRTNDDRTSGDLATCRSIVLVLPPFLPIRPFPPIQRIDQVINAS